MNDTTKRREVHIGESIRVGPGRSLLLIAGPCQIESREHCLKIAEALRRITEPLDVQLVFKSSYDKANRTSLSGARGVGIEQGLRILEEVRREFAMPVLTDVHTAEQARQAGEVVDVLQIPAFLCRQTDLLLAAGTTGRAINIKKGQFLPAEDMQFSAAKVASTGNDQILLCERGTCFGYRDLVVDMRGLVRMRASGYPVVFDATHSVQSMGGAGGASGGTRAMVAPLIRAAVATGVDGLFIECHDAPDSAPSDGATMLPLEHVAPVVQRALAIRAACGEAQ